MRSDLHVPDSRYACARLMLALLLATLLSLGAWAVVVVLPTVQADFDIDRAAASAPYTAGVIGFAAATIFFGRLTDRSGIFTSLLLGAVMLGLGFVIAGLSPTITVFSAAHGLLIGVGAAVGFGPLMSDISHWFVKRRGLAVTVVASGNYLGGAVWPLILKSLIPLLGWRTTYIVLGLTVAVVVLSLAAFMRPRASEHTLDQADIATATAQATLKIPSGLLLILLTVAAFSCCVAMSMPQVHIVAYCGDLGYGVASGIEMLSLMLFLGIISRIGSGFVADRLGGTVTLLIGSFMQAVALLMYLFFDGLLSLYLISGIFGLFQGGIIPMYAMICREILPPREAGSKIGIVVAASQLGMAFGGYASGLTFDVSGSYGLAFLNGFVWNAVNIAIVACIVWRAHQRSDRPATAGVA